MRTRYADFLGFLFPPNYLMTNQEGLVVDPGVVLDLCNMTSVPPFMTKMKDIVSEQERFLDSIFFEIIRNQGNNDLRYSLSLQHPPEDATAEDIARLNGMLVTFMTIAYEMENIYGGGFATPDVPLTERGKWLLGVMADVGMVLDLSHAGHQTARDAIEYIINKNLSLKVVATHTACHAVYGHRRNLPDDVLKGIADLGGIIGLATATFMLHSTNDTLEPFFDHLHHLLKVVGPDHVALGTDGIYRTMDVQECEKNFQMMKDKIDPRGNFQARYPDQPLELNRPDRLAVIEQGMSRHGISPVTIEKVMGENLISFFSKL